MSEYQWYEFIALDRRLTPDEMTELRSISTRAEITATRFWNEYQWGDLKADPAEMLASYFDLHLYFANWGTRRLMFRLPRQAVDVDRLRAYLPGYPAELTTTRSHVVLDLHSETEEPEDWFEAGHLAASLTPLRAELLRGDLRVAYLAWLLAVQAEEVDEDEEEPPVPAGLGAESAPLAALAEFLRVDQDLLAAAAERSGAMQREDEARRLRDWVRNLPAREQQRWLLRAVDNPDLAVGSELLGEFRSAHPPVAASRQPRTVEQLLGRAEELAAARQRQAEARLALKRAAAEAAREERLTALAEQGAAAWRELERLVNDRAYEEAVDLALELREVTVRAGEPDAFDRALTDLKQRYGRPRRGFFDRLRRAGAS